MIRGVVTTAAVIVSVCGASGAAIGQLIGVDFDNGSGSPANWNTVSTGGASGIDNLINAKGGTTNVSFSISGGSPFTSSIMPNSVPLHTSPLHGLDGYFFGNTPATARFEGLKSNTFYFVYVFGLRGLSPLDTNVEITGGLSPVNLNLFENEARVLNVNGMSGDSTRLLMTYAYLQSPDSEGGISFNFAPGSASGFWSVAGVAIQAIPDPGTMSLIAVSGLIATRRRR